MNRFEYDAKCVSCKGTGLYRGMAEGERMAVQCRSCDGTGKSHHVIEWEAPPEKRLIRDDVEWVIQRNPGIRVVLGDEQ